MKGMSCLAMDVSLSINILQRKVFPLTAEPVEVIAGCIRQYDGQSFLPVPQFTRLHDRFKLLRDDRPHQLLTHEQMMLNERRHF